MRRLSTAMGLAVAMTGLLALPGSAGHGGIHPTFKANTRYYFHCAGGDTGKVQNLAASAPFDTTAPSRSVLAGAGCGLADPGAATGQSADAIFASPIVGNIRNMTVELYLLGHTNYSAALPADVAVTLTIGTETYVGSAHVAEIPWGAGPNAAVRKIEFAITDLGWTKEVKDAEGKVVDVLYGGVVADDGDGATAHPVELSIGMWYGDEAGAWAWDATEVLSGITVNDTTLPAKRISAEQFPPE